MDKLTFLPDTHEYFLNGVKLAGVSSILRSAGFNDFSFVRADVMAAAQDFGMKVHKTTELYDIGRLDETILDPILAEYLNGWKKFLSDYNAAVADIEKMVYSKKWMCAGTLDRVVLIGKDLVLVDIKSTSSMNPAVAIQTGGYELMYEELTGKKIAKRLGVRLIENDYKAETYKNVSDKTVFLSCLQVHNWKKLNNVK